MFKGLLINEFIKLFSKKKTFIILILFIALSGILVAVNEESEKSYLKYNSLEYSIENLEVQIQYQNSYMKEIEQNEGMSKEDKELNLSENKAYLSQLEQEYTNLKLAFDNQEEVDWREGVLNQIEGLNDALEGTTDNDSKVYYMNQIEKLQIHLDKDIPLDDEYYNTGINYYIRNITMVAASFLAFGLILFNADCVSNEYNPGTLKFLLIQPVSRIKVLLSKYFTMLISSLGLIIITQFLFFLGVGLVKGFGYFERPILVGLKYEFVTQNGQKVLQQIAGSGNYISQSNYLLDALLLQGFYIFVIVTFIFMVSTLVKSSIVSMTIGISALLGSNIIYMLSSTYRKLSPFVFLHFSDIEGIISGRSVSQSGSLLFTYQTVIIVSVISAAAFLGTALIVFKKRDIQI